ncbi:hypothetical protein GCM10027408_17910 [Microbacterium tumbae]
MAIEIRYRRVRESASAFGACGREVTDAASRERFTMPPAYAAPRPVRTSAAGAHEVRNGIVNAPKAKSARMPKTSSRRLIAIGT